MIKAVIIINMVGKIRLLNVYEKEIPLSVQQELVQRVHSLISRRGADLCNFVDNFREWPTPDTRVVYRHYATLCFVFVVDSSESQLAILDLIQVFVEVLDRTFENVCELDLIFHSDKVQLLLMEMVMGGMVLETSREEVLRAVCDMQRLGNTKTGMGSSSSGYHY
ncbi:clathrin assembly sigma-adaptin protein 3, putative [Trypanosoma equiperdum]|uniref:AP complex subunit sigma n=4 Tax=Trypanozoon TaxID=39700 RepID=Q57TU5_TRYB2|nr:clathrin assembly sigma-adaptin protein 3,putative [Trypanosoma brucei gambiense DAL972]XP_847498.1 clathrin assembly sigma-adaptin protein 3, putative [Trypanosoma brucei brucei TREU927]AAX80029.1 clathrin assembly sigma-adaptin protein 3, putative [Trypanosoma brucei]RHW73302.1 clathrin assembly sigma-adaptin protein 3 [Trypanosoma brucei equiperdum]SCU70253.1 clathrin assembly sigma-adaptin protein 3, putative [Trypanosoma equiperdum]AAZ13432.1 clathrin assembly sigma-adaptin protein 3, |eukprot:XP_011776018.1 clathrin assembly sigma-adaptin protein 3,putative [Trypanosoma brucei gambiense DAL972]